MALSYQECLNIGNPSKRPSAKAIHKRLMRLRKMNIHVVSRPNSGGQSNEFTETFLTDEVFFLIFPLYFSIIFLFK